MNDGILNFNGESRGSGSLKSVKEGIVQINIRAACHLFILLVVFSIHRPLIAQPGTAWKSIFNGKNLDGWNITGGAGKVRVENNYMVLNRKANTEEHTFVRTNNIYRDFILELDCRRDTSFQYGILFRARDAADTAHVRLNGYQVKVDHTSRHWTGGIFDDFGTSWNWLTTLQQDKRAQKAEKAVGEWNHWRIEAIGNVIKVWLNGVPTAHLTNTKYDRGYIAFKIHFLGNDPAREKACSWFRNVRIIDLHPEKYTGKMDIPANEIVSRISIAFDTSSKLMMFGVDRLKRAFQRSGQQVITSNLKGAGKSEDITVSISGAAKLIQKEGYNISFINNKMKITAIDATGAMYGILDIAEQMQMGKTWQTVKAATVNPHFTVRALKYNLPWSSYRSGPAMAEHLQMSKDLDFWQAFLDQMAENRFNILSLWNIHPFSFMVRPVNFPGANNFSDQEMKEWKQFWTTLFRMAKERGIEPFIVNWNIAVSPEFAQNYGVKERNDTSAIVTQYTREVVTQVINEYPDLAGIGITLADWMSNFKFGNSDLPDMTPKDREDWIEKTVIAGIKGANRQVKLLHRSVLSSDPLEMRRVINNAMFPDTTLVEIKFNWSHGHSTPFLAMTHDSHSGKRDDGYWNPFPENYRIQWMIRNEDFFILRWGQPAFIRKHIAENTHPYVNGYFLGSEGYIPAKDFSHIENKHRNWKYAFEKQWLYYQLWGRLLYDPSTPDEVFEEGFNIRYGNGEGARLLKAYAEASQMPLKLASFFAGTWDYTLYSEGFLAPFAANAGLHDTVSSFISVDELINHPTLDPNYISIIDYVKATVEKKAMAAGMVTPLMLADSLEKESSSVRRLIEPLRVGASQAIACELDDLEAWAYLCVYFADKLRAGVSLRYYRLSRDKVHQEKAVKLLTNCLSYWKKISTITAAHYKEVPYLEGYVSPLNAYKDARYFSWIKYLPQAERDIIIAKETMPVTK
ncbi:MAG: DUF1080 domain-containing protein [Chitinophagaceae bacterium]